MTPTSLTTSSTNKDFENFGSGCLWSELERATGPLAVHFTAISFLYFAVPKSGTAALASASAFTIFGGSDLPCACLLRGLLEWY